MWRSRNTVRGTRSLAVAALTAVWLGCAPDAPEGGIPTHPSDRFSVTLAWDAPTTDAVGNPLDDLAGYRLYFNAAPPADGTGSTMLELGDVTDYKVEGLPAGTYYFAVAALDDDGNQSELSTELEVEVGSE
jgi:hypothetical protein